jgi:predicted RNA-binding Zn-ribbon protein involved in translation (DUF1610 family)
MEGIQPPPGAVGAPRYVLPVSGVSVAFHEQTGEMDLLLAENSASDPALVLPLLELLADAQPEVNWSELPVYDLDVLIIRLRQSRVGDQIVADVICSAENCGRRVDLSFNLDTYLAHHRPREARGRSWRVTPCRDAPRWYVLNVGDTEAARFRLPTLGDQIAVRDAPDREHSLRLRCVTPEVLSGLTARRVETAMSAMAPALSGAIEGRCPDCGASIDVWFDPRLYCLQELEARARFVFDDIDLLAERYHWSEGAILKLPQIRRAQYAERARVARAF